MSLSRESSLTVEQATAVRDLVEDHFGPGYWDGFIDYVTEPLPWHEWGCGGGMYCHTCAAPVQCDWYSLFKLSGLAVEDTAGDGMGRFTEDDKALILAALQRKADFVQGGWR